MSKEAILPDLLRQVHRAITELALEQAVILHMPEKALLLRGVDVAGEGMHLLLSAPRAARAGISAPGKALLLPRAMLDDMALSALTDPMRPLPSLSSVLPQPGGRLEEAALALLKQAGLLPVGWVEALPQDWREQGAFRGLMAVSVEEVTAYPHALAATLAPLSEARVPLKRAEDARIVAFGARYGLEEHLAVLVGRPEAQEAPLVRLHSSCITGDLLQSLRCDCGRQLDLALETVAAAGHGVVLYLYQEGRGIGIVNKLRAYGWQDRGLDTLDANHLLGFESDERDFEPAAVMLRRLGITRVRLMTNNPAKVASLEACGIKVVERVPHVIPAGEHNRHYLETKATRGGHLF